MVYENGYAKTHWDINRLTDLNKNYIVGDTKDSEMTTEYYFFIITSL